MSSEANCASGPGKPRIWVEIPARQRDENIQYRLESQLPVGSVKVARMDELGMPLLVGAIVVLLWLAFTYNSLVNRRNQVRYAFSSVDVQLKKRFELVPNLVRVVSGYAAHERELLETVTRARSEAVRAGAGWSSQEIFGASVDGLMARAEAYPELRADEQFLMLQRQLAECEAQIAAARRAYNASIMDYHNLIGMFPSSLVASLFCFPRMPDFEIAIAERSNPQTSF